MSELCIRDREIERLTALVAQREGEIEHWKRSNDNSMEAAAKFAREINALLASQAELVKALGSNVDYLRSYIDDWYLRLKQGKLTIDYAASVAKHMHDALDRFVGG